MESLFFLFLVFIYLIFLEELVLTRDTDGESSPLFPTRLKIQISGSEAEFVSPWLRVNPAMAAGLSYRPPAYVGWRWRADSTTCRHSRSHLPVRELTEAKSLVPVWRIGRLWHRVAHGKYVVVDSGVDLKWGYSQLRHRVLFTMFFFGFGLCWIASEYEQQFLKILGHFTRLVSDNWEPTTDSVVWQ